MSPTCTICSSPNARLCTGCRSSAYCSEECQQTDWPVHRLLCKHFCKFLAPPTDASRRAIFFPWSKTRPKSIWVQVKLGDPSKPRENSEYYDYANVDELLKNNQAEAFTMFCPHREYIRGNILRNRPSNENTIEFIVRDSYIRDHTKPNQSVNSVRGHGMKTWEGSIVVMVREGHEFENPRYGNVTLDDFRDAVDYMAWYRDTIGSASDGVGTMTPFSQMVLGAYAGKVKGVKVSCRGDRVVLGAEEFLSVDVPKSHPLFTIEGDDPSPLSEMLYRPICAKLLPAHAAWRDMTALTDRFDNPIISILYADLSTTSEEFGRARRSLESPGTVMLVDRNKRDLLPGDVQNICGFWTSKVSPLLADSAQLSGQVAKEAVLAVLVLEKYVIFASPSY